MGASREPVAAHTDRMDRCRQEVAAHRRRERWTSVGRLAAFAAIVAVAWLPVSAVWLALPTVAFLVLVVRHARLRSARERYERGEAFHRAALARIDGQWSGTGVPGDEWLEADHPYGEDLDLFGSGSLFERLCLARTRIGAATLAAWLQRRAPVEEIRRRQQAVDELAGRVGLRERLAVLAGEAAPAVDDEALRRWLTAEPLAIPAWRRAIAWIGPAAGLLTAATWAAGWTGGWPFAGALVLQALAALASREAIERSIHLVEQAGPRLDLLAAVLSILEGERFAAAWLADLRAGLDTANEPPSRRIRELARLTDLLDSRRNQLFAPFFGFLMLGTHLVGAAERWRDRYGVAVAGWLEAVGRFEALASIAAYRFENPEDPFPEIDPDEPRFSATGLGHPLLPRETCVRNDVELDAGRRMLLISGSNMSGKSTLLRAVGTNVVLALAGAPVRATALRTAGFAIGASIRVSDSLAEGRSRFYAEILKLKQISDLAAEQPPALFLLDEILHGTNSKERKQGAEALLRELLAKGALGLVTTHDLALAEIASDESLPVANVHLVDHLEDGELAFDYKLRPGIVQRGSALQLMRSIGLEV